MNSKRLLTSLFLLAFTAQFASAGILDKLAFWKDDGRIENVIVTGNVTKARLLSELIQVENETPILLFPAKPQPQEFYYLSGKPEATVHQFDKLGDLLIFLNPKNLILIGGKDVLNPTVVEVLNRSNSAIIRIDSPNWAANAQSAAKIFDYKELPSLYAAKLEDIYNRQNTPQEVEEAAPEMMYEPELPEEVVVEQVELLPMPEPSPVVTDDELAPAVPLPPIQSEN